MGSPVDCPSGQISEALAREALETVRAQFAEYLPHSPGPALYLPGFHSSGWTIAWEGGPLDWPLQAFRGEFDAEAYDRHRSDGLSPTRAAGLATVDRWPAPAGVFVEPVASWCLGLYLAR